MWIHPEQNLANRLPREFTLIALVINIVSTLIIKHSSIYYVIM
jgi:hypothetical protein